MNKYIELAINQVQNGIKNNEGGPFGAVIVKDNQIVSVANNTVLLDNDPTAHAEINAIRKACSKLKTYDLEDCIIYTTSEPCPMCLSAIIWSNIKQVYFGTNRKDVATIGFRDDYIYDYINGKNKAINVEQLNREECIKVLKEYQNKIY